MALGGILLGIINIGIVVAIFILIGLLILGFCHWIEFPLDPRLQKVYLVIVALIALYMLVAILLGIPTWRIVGGYEDRDRPVISGAVPPPSTKVLR